MAKEQREQREQRERIADALEIEAVAHSQKAHGDQDIHTDCDECKRLCKRFLEIYGITPQEHLDSFTQWPSPDEYGLKEIAKALVEEGLESLEESAWE